MRSQSGKFTGILNLFDIVCAICLPLNNPGDFASLVPKPSNEHEMTREWFTKRLTKELFSTPIQDILGVSKESRTSYVVSKSSPVAELVAHFSEGNHHALVDGDNVLSQTDLVAFLLAHREHFPEFEGALHEHGLVGRELVTAEAAGSALAAFRQMYKSEAEVRAVPVIGHDGKLVESLSASDLRGLTAYTVASLMIPVVDFLQLFPGKRNLVYCTAEDSLATATALMMESHVHRVWIVDGSHKPQGVMTMSDVIARIGRH